MAFNGSGVFSVINTFVYDTVISETAMNANFSDVATGLSTCITRDGQSTVSANIPWNSNRITGLGDGVAAQDAAALHQIQDQDGIWCGTAGGTADALTLTPSPAITAYAAGQRFTFIGGASPNTGASTVAVSGLATKAIQQNGAALTAGQIATGKLYDIVYDGTQFQLTRIGTIGLLASDIGQTVQGYDADTMISDVTKRVTANMGFTPVTDTSSGGAVTFDFSTGCVCTITLSENITGITLSGAASGDTLKIVVTQAAGLYTVTGWPAAVKWPGDVEPVVTATSGAVDIITLELIGSTYYGAYVQDFR